MNEDYRANTALIAQCLQHSSEETESISAIINRYLPDAARLTASIRKQFEAKGQHYDYALRSHLHMFMNCLMSAPAKMGGVPGVFLPAAVLYVATGPSV